MVLEFLRFYHEKGLKHQFKKFEKVLFIGFWLITFDESVSQKNNPKLFCRSQREAPTHKMSCKLKVAKGVKNVKNHHFPLF